ncbi:MAG: FadR family transcriptional regulator [Actinomycetales bacterium]|uniref:FadR family transcriptional regulator n=1 Tax=Candidatus Phosphoribacter hodrii TaxID=2953743 RepID=A0A935MAW2_9MICO|nr:FadR family transcriptional regulator [Candidatus Phosphoribacter hodrii]
MRFLDQVFDLRLAVEPLAARRAATEHVEADLAVLTEALRAMRSATSPEEHIAADLSFHRALLSAAHNELLESLAPLVEGGLRERDRLVHAAITADAVHEHAAVVAAIGRRDEAEAETAMRSLLSRSAADVTWAMTSVAGEQV